MTKSIYLINPQVDFPNYYSAEIIEEVTGTPLANIADLVLPTVAALAPADFEVTLCDEHITPVDMNTQADFIGLTGKSSQMNRMLELAKQFRERGKVVLIGGPYASLVPEQARPYCDILVRGEMEEIAPKLFDDLRAGQWQSEYIGGHPDLRLSPLPRWDLYPNDLALTGCVQTARGCPFECEFCDVIQYAGRKQRHKPVDQVIAELDQLYQYGYSDIFIADDNFTAYRKRTRELLLAIKDWNGRQKEGRVKFSTQLSIDIAQDEDILQLCGEAGIHYVFIGIETPNEESLRQSKKRQNMGIDLVKQVERFLDHGIAVMGGMIVGFDGDDLNIFERQYRFAMSSPIPFFSLGALVAPEATPLYARLKQAGRLTHDNRSSIAACPWITNIIPEQMTRTELLHGIRWLANRLYTSDAYFERLARFIELFRPIYALKEYRKIRSSDTMLMLKITENLYKTILRESPQSKQFLNVIKAVQAKQEVSLLVSTMMLQYAQTRYMYRQGQFWDPQLAQYPAPQFDS
jgi:radical SAM superfamily enzyme YgiQ (UPF0313 family)